MSTNQKELLEKHEEWQDTIEVKPKIKTNIKMRVTPEQSEKVQEICYKNGIKRLWGKTEEKFAKQNRFICISKFIIGFYDFKDMFETADFEEIDADLFIRTNGTCIEDEKFAYPMWFKSKRSDLIVRFDNLQSGKIIVGDSLYRSADTYRKCWTPHTNTEIWKQVEEPKNIIDKLAYISGLSKEEIRLKADNMFKEREVIIQERMEQYIEDIKNGEKPFLDFNKLLEEREKQIHNEHYKKQKIDTVARCKANMTLEQQKAICIFNCDKYLHREKGQNLADISKVRYYLDWLEEIENKIKEEK